jgi:hypothetical protein
MMQAQTTHVTQPYNASQVNFHCSISGQAMVTMIYRKKLEPEEQAWRTAAALLRCVSRPMPVMSLDFVGTQVLLLLRQPLFNHL